MAGISYIKGVKTRFQTTLKEEIEKASTLIAYDDTELDLDVRLRNITSCIEKLTHYEEKLKFQSEKYAIALEDDADQIEKVIDEDYVLCSRAVDMCFELDKLFKKLQHEKEKEAKEDREETESDTHTLLEIQRNMHDMLALQLKQQELAIQKDSERMSAVKLPKIDMITFSGDKTKWIEFYDSFESAVHNNKSISNVEKFNYLQSKLFGEARTAIAGLALSTGNYEVALDILKKRFGNKQEIIDMHYNQLINLNVASNKGNSLRHLLDSVEKHIRSLEVLEQNINQDIVVSIVKSKLPKVVMVQLQVQHGVDEKWTVKSLGERLREYIVAHERASKDTSSSTTQRDLHGISSPEDRRYSRQNQRTHDRLFTGGALVASEIQAKGK